METTTDAHIRFQRREHLVHTVKPPSHHDSSLNVSLPLVLLVLLFILLFISLSILVRTVRDKAYSLSLPLALHSSSLTLVHY